MDATIIGVDRLSDGKFLPQDTISDMRVERQAYDIPRAVWVAGALLLCFFLGITSLGQFWVLGDISAVGYLRYKAMRDHGEHYAETISNLSLPALVALSANPGAMEATNLNGYAPNEST